MRSHLRTEQGFGMVVVAMLFTAFAVVAAMVLDRDAVKTEINKQQQVEAQLTRLNVALVQYARFNADRFPCPASWILAPGHTDFGKSFAATCSVGAIVAAQGVELATSSNSKLLMGMVPVKELIPYGISYGDAFDAWGSRIVYAVHRDLTTGTTSAAVTAANSALNERATVSDYLAGGVITPEPDAILISYGRDRMNGRLRNQSAPTSPSISCASAGQNRYLNCDGNRSFIRGPLFTAPSASAGQYFDDTISAIRYF